MFVVEPRAIVVAAAILLTFLWPVYLLADCPPGTVQVGQQTEETENAIIVHPVCQPLSTPAPAPANQDLEDRVCAMKLRVAADQDAIRALDFKSDTEQFKEFEDLAKDAKNDFQHKALDAVLGSSLDAAQDKIKAAKSLTPWNVNTRIKELQKAGLNSEPIFDAMRKIAALRGKPEVEPFIHTFLKGIEVEKEAADTKKEIAKEQANAKLRVLLAALKIAEGNPELGLIATGADFGESLAYGYYLNRSIDQLDALTDDQLKRLNVVSIRLRKDVNNLNQEKRAWSKAFPGRDQPSCGG